MIPGTTSCKHIYGQCVYACMNAVCFLFSYYREVIDHKINSSHGSGEPSAKKQRLEEARTVKKVILFNAVMFAFSRFPKFSS